MQKRKDGPQGDVPPPTRMLQLAEKWARHRHDGTSLGAATFGEGPVEPMVQIHHGSVPIFVRDLGKCLMVLGVLDIPPPVSDRLAQMSAEERGQFLSDLEKVLMSCPRIGFAFDPRGSVQAGALRRIVLDQTLQIAENDAASFNRFCDAIQETETLLLRAAAQLTEFLASGRGSPQYSSSSPPPTDLYL
jgi:hypothetical protein